MSLKHSTAGLKSVYRCPRIMIPYFSVGSAFIYRKRMAENYSREKQEKVSAERA
jgi:hypothetical protein